MTLHARHCPPPQPLRGLITGTLQVVLPGGPYTVPATLAPMLLAVRTGRVATLDGQGPPELYPINLCGGTAAVRRLWAEPGTELWLTPLRQGMCARLLGVSPAALFGQLLAPSMVGLTTPSCNSHGKVSGLAAWHHWLLSLAERHQDRTAGVVFPVDWLAQPVADLARRLDWGERQLERRFHAAHGQSLRAYRPQARCSRLLMQVARQQTGGDTPSPILWADLAAQSGYADQAHLCRDVLRYTGHRPSDLLSGLRQQDPALWPFHVSPVTTQRWFGTQGY